ncbi:hypothetical protein E2320_000722 [Naja naja]|nr:hypothetical protein E2320_000722 [Naja naja]
MNCIHLFLAFVLFNPRGITAYGFRNCIQDMKDPLYFKCMQRFLDNISSIVDDLPDNAEVVNASHNAIQVLPYRSFRHLPQLKNLQLSYNKMEKIEGGAFENLGALEWLNLSCNHLTNLSKGIFLGLANLTLLLLHNNHLSVLHLEAFSPLPSLLDLQLQFNNLNSFDVVIRSVQKLNQLKHLNLCNNNLSLLQPGVGFPPSLYNLKLCNNSLRKMEGPGPRFLGNVMVLDLSYNKFSDASSFANVSLQRLQRLKLVGNNIDVLQLLDMSNLKPRSLDYSGLHLNKVSQLTKVCQHLGKSNRPFDLFLQSNNLRNLSYQSFLACPPIQLLDLSRNRLQSVDCVRQMLNGTAQSRLTDNHFFPFQPHPLDQQFGFPLRPNLTTLHLNINSIAFLHAKALKGLKQLRELRLDNNLLTDIYGDSFSDLSNLQILNLRNNHVSVLFPGTFKSLGKLSILDLGGNNIHRLANMSFEGLKNLSNLYLDNNYLQYISPSFFHPIERTLQVLDLMGNKIYFISKNQLKQPPFGTWAGSTTSNFSLSNPTV